MVAVGGSAQRLDSFANAGSHIVLGHLAISMSQQLLRVRQVASVGRGLRPDVPKLETHARRAPRLVEA